MSDPGVTQKNSNGSKMSLKDGEEPTELLLALVSSPLITLLSRNEVQVLEAKKDGAPVVLAIFTGYKWDEQKGLVLAEEAPTVPTVPPTVAEKVLAAE